MEQRLQERQDRVRPVRSVLESVVVSATIKNMNTGREVSGGNSGFVKIILLIVIGLVVLGYFGIDIKDVFASPVVKENLSYAWGVAKDVWSSYLSGPAIWLWEHIFKFMWNLFLDGLSNLKAGDGPSSLMQQ